MYIAIIYIYASFKYSKIDCIYNMDMSSLNECSNRN